jgi:aspartyl-tRNA(Asn)/glutamyl-tRNA(Gln) amidotransferase subunit A
MPVVVKDNIDVAGVGTTVGSRLFADRVAAADAEVTRRLHSAGVVILGKANLHELAFGATSANEAFGPVVNPAAPERIPGGSSGGSGVAVAADLCVAALGTDTGGSVRLPASLCGVSGLRPTFGAVSNRGVQPVSASLDTVGPFARSVADLRSVLAAIAGFDPGDPTSVDAPLDLGGPQAIIGLRVGLIESLVERSDPAVAVCVREVAGVFSSLGSLVSEVDLPGWEAAVDACGRLIKGEALGVYRGSLSERPELLEEGTRRRLALAEGVTPEELDELREQRERWTESVGDALATLDLLLLPTVPVEAPSAQGADTVETTAAVAPYTHVFSFAGVPALSIPCGVTPTGGPVGAQLVAARWCDGFVLRMGAAVQSETDWHLRR